MSMLGIEEVLAQMQAKLQADLPAKVDELNDEYDDGCLLTAPDAASYRRIFDPADQAELEATTFPAVVLRPEPEAVTDGPDIGSEYEVEHAVEIAFLVGYDTREHQETRLLRYMRAAKEILGPLDALDAGDTRYRGGGFARTWTTSNGIVRDVALIFTTTVHETP
jgi:hypothetical protein